MRGIAAANLAMMLLAAVPAAAEDDAEGYKDHPMFTWMADMYLYSCGESQFDLRKFPVGAAPAAPDQPVKSVDVEGPVRWVTYATRDGAKLLSGLQIMLTADGSGAVASEYVKSKPLRLPPQKITRSSSAPAWAPQQYASGVSRRVRNCSSANPSQDARAGEAASARSGSAAASPLITL